MPHPENGKPAPQKTGLKVLILRLRSHQSQLASPFTRMILFLGIFFLFTVVKDVLSSAESSKAITRMQEKTFTLAGQDRISLPTFLSQKEAL